MVISWDVTGFFDWEDAEKLGVTVTEADVKAKLAKPMMNGKYGVKVEKTLDTHHDMAMHELAICRMVAERAAAGIRTTREAAVCERIREQTMKEHIARRHIKAVTVHDAGPDKELMRWALAACGVDGKAADNAMADYDEDVDVAASIAEQFGPPRRRAK